jgi:hypothetical protein
MGIFMKPKDISAQPKLKIVFYFVKCCSSDKNTAHAAAKISAGVILKTAQE